MFVLCACFCERDRVLCCVRVVLCCVMMLYWFKLVVLCMCFCACVCCVLFLCVWCCVAVLRCFYVCFHGFVFVGFVL